MNSEQKSVGPVVGSIIIVLVIVLGGLYFWGSRLNREETLSGDDIRNSSDAALGQLVRQSNSDDLSAIEADAKATNLDGLDSEVNKIEKELQAK